MPWQRQVADVALELVENDAGLLVPAYREVVVTIPRQNGKTTLTLAFEIQRAVGWDDPQRIAYTAQTGKDAREKLLNDQAPLLDPKLPPNLPVKLTVRRVLRGIGNEGVEFKNGSRIIVLASGEESGHGKVIDLGVIDESFADEDDRREQAMLPAMLTRPTAQILNISTAGTDRSPFLKRKVDAGRSAVTEGRTDGVAYFEWSCTDPDADIDDPATWWACMPALGRTIDEAVVRHARQVMSEGDFRRAMLNQWTVSDERVIPASVWQAACDPSAHPDGVLVFGIDVSEDRTSASIAVADDDGRLELVDYRDGVAWLTDRVIELAKRHDADVVVDGLGPAARFAELIRDAEVDVHTYDTRQVSQACAAFYDGVADGTVQVRPHADLDRAVAAAQRRHTGDTWVWARRNVGEDISPLVAATIAYDKAAGGTAEPLFAFG
jgi:phage terminase large subunit-like protein